MFKAGAAVGDITPELGQLIVGNWDPLPASHIHDALSVRALVLDDGVQRLAFVVCDNVGLSRAVCDEAKALTTRLTGIAASHLMISATHTHSAVTADSGQSTTETQPAGEPSLAKGIVNYQTFIARRVADTVQRAINQLEPARIGWGSGREPGQVFNRRWHVRDEADRRNPFGGVDRVRMNPPRGSAGLIEPAGPVDPEICFISVQARSGRPIALFASYSLHYVGGVPPGLVSADYFGAFGTRIGELLGASNQHPAFVGIMANGTSGNINNIDFRKKGGSEPPFEKIRKVANAIAAEVYRAHQTIAYHDWVSLDARHEELPMSARRPSTEQLTWAQDLVKRPGALPGWHRHELTYARRVLQRAAAPETVQLPLQVFRVGDLGIMTVPAEVFVEIGLELKAKAPFSKAFTVSLANGSFGYLPTVEQHELGGYETWIGTNKIEIGAAPKIVEALLRMSAGVRVEMTDKGGK